jgi:hypothetical protein
MNRIFFQIAALIVLIANFSSLGCKSPTGGDVGSGTPISWDGRPIPLLQGADIEAQIAQAREVRNLPGTSEIVVSGRKSFDEWFIKADKLVFESGATLVFSKQAQSKHSTLLIVAKQILCRDSNSPGTITWERDAPAPPSGIGAQAPGGQDGTANGVAGQQGASGGPGTNGSQGGNAPSILIISLELPPTNLSIDFNGNDGGSGGPGIGGGQGGRGGAGDSASQSLFNCNRGAGNGGPGGSGGRGGKGGDGGQGGAGGHVTLLAPHESIGSSASKIKILVNSGRGGDPGAGGNGGQGGIGGPGGSGQAPYCAGGGNAGSPGSNGPAGTTGERGQDGRPGQYAMGSISTNTFGSVWAQ